MAKREHGDRDERGEHEQPESILRITDELVSQVYRTKKLVIVMIIAVVIAIPVSWHVAPILIGSPQSFIAVGAITIILALLFIVLGIRQWMILSLWTRRYKEYKERLKKVDDELDFEKGGN